MSFDAIETSGYTAQNFDLFLFQVGSTTYALTNEDASITWNGNTYQPTAISRDEIELSQEQTSGQVKITLPRTHSIAELFVPYLPASPVELTIYSGHYGDDDTIAIFVGRVASARYPDECELTCVTDRDDLKRRVPTLLYQPSCPRVFGDAGCTVKLATLTTSGTIGTVDATGTVLTVAAFASLPHSLRGGYLTRGNDVRLVIDHSGAQITLLSAISGLAPGQSVSGTAGCAKTYADCTSFANVANFLGFDMIPTRNPFEGRIV